MRTSYFQESDLTMLKFELEVFKEKIQSFQYKKVTPFQISSSPPLITIDISPTYVRFFEQNSEISFSKLIAISKKNQKYLGLISKVINNLQEIKKENETTQKLLRNVQEELLHEKTISLERLLEIESYQRNDKENQFQKHYYYQDEHQLSQKFTELEICNTQLKYWCNNLQQQNKQLKQTIKQKEQQISWTFNQINSYQEQCRILKIQLLETQNKLKFKNNQYEYLINLIEKKKQELKNNQFPRNNLMVSPTLSIVSIYQINGSNNLSNIYHKLQEIHVSFSSQQGEYNTLKQLQEPRYQSRLIDDLETVKNIEIQSLEILKNHQSNNKKSPEIQKTVKNINKQKNKENQDVIPWGNKISKIIAEAIRKRVKRKIKDQRHIFKY